MISRVAKRGGGWDAMFAALIINGGDLLGELFHRLVGHSQMIASMVANLETVLVQFGYLLPRHVVLFVLLEIEPLGNIKGSSKPVFLEDRAHHGCNAT